MALTAADFAESHASKGGLTRLIPIVEFFFGIAIVMVFSYSVQTFLVPRMGNEDAGSPVQQAVIGSLSLTAIALMLVRGITRQQVAVLIRLWPLFLLIGWAGLSVLWSDQPIVTARRAFTIVLALASVLYLAFTYPPQALRRLLKTCSWVFVFLTILSLAVKVGIHTDSWWPALKGFSGQKNPYGEAAATFLVFAGYCIFSERKMSFGDLVLMGILTVFLLWSLSQTSIMAVVTMVVSFPIMRLFIEGRFRNIVVSKGIRALIGIGIPVVSVFVAFVIVPFLVVDVLGKTLTFNGRLGIWRYAIAFTEGREWLGAGFRAFWTGEVSAWYMDWFTWKEETSLGAPSTSHSSYVDMYDELGIIGCVLLFIFVLSLFRPSNPSASLEQRRSSLFLSSMAIIMLVAAFSEWVFLNYNAAIWTGLCLALVGYHLQQTEPFLAASSASAPRGGAVVPAGVLPALRQPDTFPTA